MKQPADTVGKAIRIGGRDKQARAAVRDDLPRSTHVSGNNRHAGRGGLQ